MRFYWAKRLVVAGAGICSLLMLTFYKGKILWAFTATTYYNYLGMRMGPVLFNAFRTTSDKGPVATMLETRLFDAFLIITSALEWFIVGMVIDWVVARRRARPR